MPENGFEHGQAPGRGSEFEESTEPSGFRTGPEGGEEGTVRASRTLAPLHKVAFGAAVGAVAGSLIFAVTAFQLIVRADPAPDLSLLSEFFFAYRVSWEGAFIGLGWGLATGFVIGWFAALCRNFLLAAFVLLGRARADFDAARDLLDYI